MEEGGNKTKTRGMTIEDVNKITGVTADGSTITPAGINLYDSLEGAQKYGTQLKDFQKNTQFGWTPSALLSASDTDKSNGNSPGITEKVSAYYYEGNNSSLKTADTNSIRYKLIFGESSDKTYWLASRSVYANSNAAVFGPGQVGDGEANSYSAMIYSSNYPRGRVKGVCPVVYLDSGIILSEDGTTNGVTTWNIKVK